tara:strand:- start:6559 stop:6726 length:168 start_codon:yes stop_codon:yes gene_type:complete
MCIYVVVSRVCEPYEPDCVRDVSVHKTLEEAFKNTPNNTYGYAATYYYIEVREKN